MKTSVLFAIVAGTTLAAFPVQTALADDTNAATTTPPATGATDSGGGADRAQKMEKFKAALAQLELSDDQKAKIKDILANEPKGRERRQHIMGVLTPDQKSKLLEMIQERQEANGN